MALVIIRSDASRTGLIKVTAKSPGLMNAIVEVNSKESVF